MIEFKVSYNIDDYSSLKEKLYSDFGSPFIETIEYWCENRENNYTGKFWQLWIIYQDDILVGVCGLYSLKETIDELWLGWFGILPEYRNMNIGSEVLTEIKRKSIGFGSKRIYSYVDKEGRPLPFYYRNGFTRMCTVQEYLESNGMYEREDFESLEDHVIAINIS